MISYNECMVDHMTKAYCNYVRNTDSQEKIETSETFMEEVTLEQYKKLIYEKISQIPVHPSQRLNSIAIHISDSGFKAMKDDPEYEK